MPDLGLIVVKSNADLDREQQERIDAELAQTESVESELASHIRKVWESCKRAKDPVERRMLAALRRINGKYDPEKETEILAQGMPLIYMRIVSIKSRAAKGWIRDILMPAGDKPWSISPTPSPTLPPDVTAAIMQRVEHDALQFMQVTGQQLTPGIVATVTEQFASLVKRQIQQQADLRASRMSDLIEDQLDEGGWNDQLELVISDLVDYPAAIMKGPVVRKERKIAWTDAGAQVVETAAPQVERVDPFAFYPAPGVIQPDDGDCIEVHDYTRSELLSLKGLPGYKSDAIDDVVANFSRLKDWSRQALDSSISTAIGDTSSTQYEHDTIEALEYWGDVMGDVLLDWGASELDVPDPTAIYQVMAVLVGRNVICMRLNHDPLGRKPYSKACFETMAGSFWGVSISDLIGDCEDVCNAAARAIVANMGIASGPQVAINSASMPTGEDITSMFPWKIWQLDYTKTGASTRSPIEFWQPNPMTTALMDVYKFYSNEADEYSGLPSYVYGAPTGVRGAGNTASGLSMLMNSASKTIKNVVAHMDGLISGVVQRFYDWNMLYSNDDSIKGDAQVIARGAMSLVMKEANQARVQELLAQTANPVDMQIIGVDGRAALLRRAIQGVDVGGDEIIPTAEELHQKEQLAQIQQQQAQMQQQAQQPVTLNVAGQPMGQPQ